MDDGASGDYETAGIVGCSLVAITFDGAGWGVHEGGASGKRIAFYDSRNEAVARIKREYDAGLYVTNWALWREPHSA